MMNISKVLPIDTFEFDELWKILLEDLAPTLEVELVLILLDVVPDAETTALNTNILQI